jgi:photosystem II stability/assembly factor-like uncharacterized protein
MKFKILLSLGITLLFSITNWFSDSNDSKDQTYVSREASKKAQNLEALEEYYRSLKANIHTGQIELEDAAKMRLAVDKFARTNRAKNDEVEWEFMGPNNVGGRTRALMVYEEDVNILLAGSVSGGLFRSTNRAQSWEPLPGFDENLIVGSIARLRFDGGGDAIYVGTGHSREPIEGVFPQGEGESAFLGGGLYVSTDGGDTWSLVSDFAPGTWTVNDDWAFTNKLAADPSNPQRLWVGTNFGLRPYIHGSGDLEPLPSGLGDDPVSDFAVSPDGSTIIVAQDNEVFVSTDFGQTFEQRNNGAFTTSGNETIDVAIAPDNANEMYASVSNTAGTLKAVYGTLNAGGTWTAASPPSTPGIFAPFINTAIGRPQGNYNNMITVVPNPEPGSREVILGGVSLYKYTIPLGSTPTVSFWETIAAVQSSFPGAPPSPNYVHANIHTEVWDSEGRLYLGTDGGIFMSPDNGGVYLNMNNNYTTTQYYSVAFNPSGQFLGGVNGEGTLWVDLEGLSSQQAERVTAGDGFDCEISQEDPNFMFTTQYFGGLFRTSDGGLNWFFNNELFDESDGSADFSTDIAFHENMNNEFSRQFVDYIPAIDDPNLVDVIPPEVTANGDTIIKRIPAGTTIVTEADNSNFEAATTLTEDLNFYSYYVRTVAGNPIIFNNVADTLPVQEKEQFLLAAALSGGVFITRQPLKTNGTPEWFQISEDENPGVNPSAVEWSPDGDHLYVGYTDGRLIRFSGFNDSWTEAELVFDEMDFNLERTVIHNGTSTITDIDVDYSQGRGTVIGGPPASERVAITIGRYGGSGKVRVSNVAASTDESDTFESIWNVPTELQGMPCYSVVMDLSAPNDILMVGTEYGVFYTGDGGNTWTSANNGEMPRVPVFDLRQQKQPDYKVENSGVVYAATHGRGMFRTGYLLNPNTSADFGFEVAELGPVKVFPNPTADMATIQFDLGVNEQVDIYVYSIEGRLVKAVQNNRIESGQQKQVRLNVSDLSSGTYIVQVQAGEYIETAKFIKKQ